MGRNIPEILFRIICRNCSKDLKNLPVLNILVLVLVLTTSYPVQEYNCSLIKVDCLAACIAPRVLGAVLAVFLWHWRKLTNKKQGNMDYVKYMRYIVKPT
jgi:hypothetical protein